MGRAMIRDMGAPPKSGKHDDSRAAIEALRQEIIEVVGIAMPA
jgi:hypothetical protein